MGGSVKTLDDWTDPEIYVIDTETTGLNGYPHDVVVDIAICRVSLGTYEIREEYSSVVGYDVSGWTDVMRTAWIFQNTDLTIGDVSKAPDAEKVADDVRSLLNGKNVTSFNKGFDMDKFLYHRPWSIKDVTKGSRCIMLASKDVCKLPGLYGDYKWPRLDQAYSMIVKGDPANINGTQTHRALSDALMASYILIELHRTGRY